MKIFNVRLGLATNSSSSHSLIFLKEGIKAFDYNGYHHSTEPWENTTEESDGEFGWQRFTAASAQTKMHYLSILLRDRLYQELPHNIADIICRSWTGRESFDGYIDHQSFYCLPCGFGSNLPDEDFFRALTRYFMQENLVILGGNDNTSANHPLDDGSTFKLPIPKDCGMFKYVCRYDEANDYWTTFCQTNGTKLRFRLTNEPENMSEVPNKASAPELVDIKITDYCPYGCEFCYQSSTVKGEHSNTYELYRLSKSLSKLKVFEVALGGGEPTLHPGFETILSYFHGDGIVPNFTTRNLQWLRDPHKWTKYMEYAGAFAFSVSEPQEITELTTLLDYNGIHHDRANLHFVMGTMDVYKFRNLLRKAVECDLSVTLLGYKQHGLGLQYAHTPYDWWLTEIRRMQEDNSLSFPASISIDTVMAKAFERQIIESGIPSWMFTTEEGKFSCYIDAVSNKMGPSSFCKPEEMVEIKDEFEMDNGDLRYLNQHEVIQEIFSGF